MAPVSKDKKVSPPLPVAVTPADNKKKTTTTTTTTPPAVVVCLWALANAFVFAVSVLAKLILNLHSCTKSTWLFRCVALTDAAAAEVSLLLFGEVLCSTAALLAVAAALPMLLTTTETTTTTSRMRGAVDALAWVALAATAGIHGVKIAYDRIFLAAADAGDTNIFVDVVLRCSILVAVDLLAGVLLCYSPRRLELAEQKGGGDGVVV